MRSTSTQLLAQGFTSLRLKDAPFADGGFPTPSGKCEFFSQRLADQGLDGLPDHVPNYEVPGSSAQLTHRTCLQQRSCTHQSANYVKLRGSWCCSVQLLWLARLHGSSCGQFRSK